jgi:hypothetical protein
MRSYIFVVSERMALVGLGAMQAGPLVVGGLLYVVGLRATGLLVSSADRIVPVAARNRLLSDVLLERAGTATAISDVLSASLRPGTSYVG